MKLYLVHCGFYDLEVSDGVYEFHVNYPVVALDFEDARARVKQRPEFHGKKMHVDGVQEIQVVDGFRIELREAPELEGQTLLVSHRHRDLARRTDLA